MYKRYTTAYTHFFRRRDPGSAAGRRRFFQSAPRPRGLTDGASGGTVTTVMVVLIILGFALLILGIIGCVLPVIPGPPLAYLSLIRRSPASTRFVRTGITAFASEEIKHRYLPGCVSGEIVTAIAMTEPGTVHELITATNAYRALY